MDKGNDNIEVIIFLISIFLLLLYIFPKITLINFIYFFCNKHKFLIHFFETFIEKGVFFIDWK